MITKCTVFNQLSQAVIKSFGLTQETLANRDPKATTHQQIHHQCYNLSQWMQKLDNDYLEASRNAHFDKAREIVIDYDRVKVAVETALKSPSFTGSQRCFHCYRILFSKSIRSYRYCDTAVETNQRNSKWFVFLF